MRLAIIACILAIFCITLACNKNEERAYPDRYLLGTWVDINHPADSLLIYSMNSKIVLYDNSMACRTHPNPGSTSNAFTWNIKPIDNGMIIVPDSIGFVENQAYFVDYVPYSFKWIIKGFQFKIDAIAFRPYTNCADCPPLNYIRVK